MDTRSVVVSIGIVGLVSVFLRLTGLTENFWLTLGLVGIPVVLYWIQSAIRPQNEKLANGLSRFAVGWAIVFILVPALFTLISTSFPRTKESTTLARKDTDLRLGELAYPAGYYGRLAYRRFCNGVTEEAELKVAEELRLKEDEFRGKIRRGEYVGVLADVVKDLRTELEDIRRTREECAEWVISDLHPRKILARLEGARGHQWFAGLSLLVIGGFVVAVVFGNPAISRATFRLAILVGILVATNSLIWGGGELTGFAKEGVAAMESGKYPSEMVVGRTWYWILAFMALGGTLLASITGNPRLRRGALGVVTLAGLILLIDWALWAMGGVSYLKSFIFT